MEIADGRMDGRGMVRDHKRALDPLAHLICTKTDSLILVFH